MRLFDNKKLVADMILLSAKTDSEHDIVNDIMYIVEVHDIRYMIDSTDDSESDVIIAIYCDYISKSDLIDYTSTLYFRLSHCTVNVCNRLFKHYTIEYLNELDCH
jgi:hypothetical protein